MNEIICQYVKELAELISQSSLINLDFANVKTIIEAGGMASILCGEASRDGNAAKKVVEDSLSHSLLDADYRDATGALICITGGKHLTLEEMHQITNGILEGIGMNSNVKVIWSGGVLPEMEDKIKVMAIISGVKRKVKK